MEKIKYSPANLEIVNFATSDIVTASSGFDGVEDEFWC